MVKFCRRMILDQTTIKTPVYVTLSKLSNDDHTQESVGNLRQFLKYQILNLRINFYLLRTFPPHLGSFLCCFFFHYVSAKFHLWPSSDDLPQPRIGMLSLVTVPSVITACHSCCLSHHVFDQVNHWPA